MVYSWPEPPVGCWSRVQTWAVPKAQRQGAVGYHCPEPTCHPVMTELSGVADPRGAEQGPPRALPWQQPLLLQALPSVRDFLLTGSSAVLH